MFSKVITVCVCAFHACVMIVRKLSGTPAYVSPPNPMEVKKLIANRVLRGLSRGINPSNAVDRNLYKVWS